MENEEKTENKKIFIGKLTYELLKKNPDTGWLNVVNGNGTSFWMPEEIVKEIERLDSITGGLQMKLKDLRARNDNHRRSADYFKSDRDNYKELVTSTTKKYNEAKLLTKSAESKYNKLLDDSVSYQSTLLQEKRELESQVREGRRLLVVQKGATLMVTIISALLFLTLIVMGAL